ncbi:MAG: T9SS type A sorting domain-containing protein, partial [Bacteroidia bacterium]|nr:T9SS type A sorting domain-containing protein [Bacteroidia bacterium]
LPSKLYSFNNASFTLSINEFEARSLAIYPNPVYDKLNIRVSSAENIKYIEVFDVTGKRLLEKKKNLSDSINFSNVRNGLYFIKIVLEDNAVFYKKILKWTKE